MSGIILILVGILWLVIAFFVVKFISKPLPEIWWTYLLRVVLFLALLPLPIIDEIVGARQFEKLCKENSTIQVDRTKAAGKTVYLAEVSDVQIKGTWVPVWLQSRRYVDATTGETLISYNTLRAGSGMLGPTSLGPLTFDGECVSPNRPATNDLFRELGIKSVQRPVKK